MALYIVRHAMPDVDAAKEPHLWVLTDRARRSARGLTAQLPNSGRFRWVSSTEVKARQTIEEMAAAHGDGEVITDEAFGEVRRPFDGGGDYRRLAHEYVTGTVHPGWETHDAVIARFDAAARRHVAAADGAHVVIASHGMAMTLWLSRTLRIGDTGQFWSELAFPDLVTVGSGRVREGG